MGQQCLQRFGGEPSLGQDLVEGLPGDGKLMLLRLQCSGTLFLQLLRLCNPALCSIECFPSLVPVTLCLIQLLLQFTIHLVCGPSIEEDCPLLAE